MSIRRYISERRDVISGVSIFYIALLIASVIVGYLDAKALGIAWGIALSLTYFVSAIPFVGGFIYHFVIVPWVNSFIPKLTPAMLIIEGLWIGFGYVITVLMTILVILSIVVSR